MISSLLDSQITGVLATETNHQPYANLVAFSFSADLTRIFFATLSNTSKYRNLSENSNVSIVIDSRKNDPNDFSGSMTVTAMGRAGELSGDEKIKILQVHSERLPGLAGFLVMASITVFEIKVHKYIITNGLNKVSEFKP